MKQITAISVLFLFMLILSCSKNSETSSTNPIVGSWRFTNQTNISFPYPSGLNNPFATGTSNFIISNDSIKVSFDNNGNYFFSNFRLPIDIGTYKIIQDSFLIIKPDTAGLIKFCYNVPVFIGGTGLPPNPILLTPFPYTNFQFSSDTIILKISNNSEVDFTAYRFTKRAIPYLPSGDTITSNKITSNFIRLK